MLCLSFGKKKKGSKVFTAKSGTKLFLIQLLILTFCLNGQTQGFGMSVEIDRTAELLKRPKNQKIKKNEPSPYSGILISEEQFRQYEFAMDENDILNKHLAEKSLPENCESCFKSNVLAGITGTAIGALITSIFFMLIK